MTSFRRNSLKISTTLIDCHSPRNVCSPLLILNLFCYVDLLCQSHHTTDLNYFRVRSFFQKLYWTSENKVTNERLQKHTVLLNSHSEDVCI